MIRLNHLFDTIIMQFSLRQQKIILLLIEKGSTQSSFIHSEITKRGEKISLVTIKRELSALVELGALTTSGSGRSVAYAVGISGRIFTDIDAQKYCAIEPDNRHGMKQYNFDLFSEMPTDIFSDNEQKRSEEHTEEYTRRTKD